MRYASGTKVEIRDIVFIPSMGAFAGHVAGIFPPDGVIEVISDNPSDDKIRIAIDPALVIPWCEY